MISKFNLLLLAVFAVGCSHPKQIPNSNLEIGVCNIVVGDFSEYDSSKSYQEILKPTDELQRKHAMSIISWFIQDHPDDSKCTNLYRDALIRLEKMQVKEKLQ